MQYRGGKRAHEGKAALQVTMFADGPMARCKTKRACKQDTELRNSQLANVGVQTLAQYTDANVHLLNLEHLRDALPQAPFNAHRHCCC